ncbi:MAG: hypothetical protein U5L74_01275 [Ideonella sp.]|nr:hypothetical protein [Ideonella sp.]
MSAGLLGHYDLCGFLILDCRVGMAWRCCVIGAQGRPHAVLLLTARDELRDRVQAWMLGRTVPQVEPFDLPELLARIRALKRRSEGRIEECLALGGCSWTSRTENCCTMLSSGPEPA